MSRTARFPIASNALLSGLTPEEGEQVEGVAPEDILAERVQAAQAEAEPRIVVPTNGPSESVVAAHEENQTKRALATQLMRTGFCRRMNEEPVGTVITVRVNGVPYNVPTNKKVTVPQTIWEQLVTAGRVDPERDVDHLRLNTIDPRVVAAESNSEVPGFY